MITRFLLSDEGGVGPALANHLWQSTAFVLAAWLVTLPSEMHLLPIH